MQAYLYLVYTGKSFLATDIVSPLCGERTIYYLIRMRSMILIRF